MRRQRLSATWFLGLLLPVIGSSAIGSEPAGVPANGGGYAYATAGIKDHIEGGLGVKWKILLDESNLGGKELQMVEATFPPGLAVPSHTHGSVEIIYVLSGTYEHEVNGKLYRLTPGMVGLVRPGDHVRHLVPESAAAKVLIIWVPAGELQRGLAQARGTAISPLEPVGKRESPPVPASSPPAGREQQ
jgi:quercetin dioxygenase-like cupin family protein